MKVKDNSGDKEKICGFFLRGKCRHEMSGKVPNGDTEKCGFIHPEACMNYLNNGEHKGDCNKGDKCEKIRMQEH